MTIDPIEGDDTAYFTYVSGPFGRIRYQNTLNCLPVVVHVTIQDPLGTTYCVCKVPHAP